MNVNELCAQIAATLPPLFGCSAAPYEGARVTTPLRYPDGGIVDVFVLERQDGYVLTDFGEALGWLRMQSSSDNLSPRQNRFVNDVCRTLGVRLERGELILRIGKNDALGEAVLRLAQAVVRVSDIRFTFQRQRPQTTAKEVEKWLRERQINFQRSVFRQGISQKNWRVNFETQSDNRTSMVFLLSARDRSNVSGITEHVTAAFTDLGHLKESQSDTLFVSLFDDSRDVWREEDYNLVKQVSTIAQWSQPDEFEHILRNHDHPH